MRMQNKYLTTAQYSAVHRYSNTWKCEGKLKTVNKKFYKSKAKNNSYNNKYFSFAIIFQKVRKKNYAIKYLIKV